MSLDDGRASLVTAVENLDVDADTLHAILADRRRRYVLARLQESVSPMHLGDLAEAMAAWERDRDDVEEPADPETIHQSLYHVHVAKMAEAGLVDYDGMCDKVALAERGHALAAHLSPAADV